MTPSVHSSIVAPRGKANRVILRGSSVSAATPSGTSGSPRSACQTSPCWMTYGAMWPQLTASTAGSPASCGMSITSAVTSRSGSPVWEAKKFCLITEFSMAATTPVRVSSR